MSGPHRPVGELVRLVEAVGRADSADEICRCALDRLQQTLAIDRASVLVVDDWGQLRVRVWRGLSEAYRIVLEHGWPCDAGAREPAPVVVSDVAADEALVAPLRSALEGEGIASAAFIPLSFAGRLLGGLALHRGEGDAFGDGEIATARVVAGHVAMALERDEVQRRLRRHTDLLVRAGRALSRRRDLDEIFEALSEVALPALADAVAIHLIDPRGGVGLAHVACADAGKLALARRAFEGCSSPGAEVGPVASIESGCSGLLTRSDGQRLERLAAGPQHLASLEAVGVGATIVVPLSRSRPLGSMTLWTFEPGRALGEADLEVAEALASRATLAIDNVRLDREAERARRSAEELALRFDVLSRASASIATSLDPDVALQQLARLIASTVADCCVAFRLGDDGSIRRVGLAHADAGAEARLEEMGQGKGPQLDDDDGVGAVLRTGKPVLVREIASDFCQAGSQNVAALRQLGVLSSIVVPLEARGRTLGALVMMTTTRSRRRYRHSDLALALELAGRAALLVDNARLYDQARRASQARDELLAIVSHDLRSPLNTIVAASDLLRRELPEEQRARTRAGLARATARMTRLLDDLLDTTRIDRGLAMNLAPFDVIGLVSEIVSMHQPLAQSCAIRLLEVAPEAPLEIDGDRDRLGQALTNLLANALEYTPGGGEVRVTVEMAPGLVRIIVADTGPGISREDLPYLFERFWRADPDSSKGLGLGLTIAKGIAEAHRGNIVVRSRPGEGARFVMELPVS